MDSPLVSNFSYSYLSKNPKIFSKNQSVRNLNAFDLGILFFFLTIRKASRGYAIEKLDWSTIVLFYCENKKKKKNRSADLTKRKKEHYHLRMGKYTNSKPIVGGRVKNYQKKKFLHMKRSIGFPYNLVDSLETSK